ncbi:MAG: 16S rRNA (cytosine(1402)-N(4))-methyltransferase RsmH [Bacilli bacterium]|nr:16S rRNA (cytosine(1402)-N(4))-methyltransferase RsmH [Bacilli bacterium]
MHKTVLLNEAIDNLNVKEDGIYVDATLGFGGHSGLILKRIKRGFLFAFDQDDMAIEYSKKKLEEIGSNFEIIKANFVNLEEELNKRGITRIDGIVFDLGVSSPQLDIPERGFSYHNDAPLDMRMDTDSDFSAYNVVNEYSYDDLVRILRDYGEEKYACSIAKNIVKEREKGSIDTTLELVDIIKKSMPYKAMREGHPARRSFQAIRIEVNHELDVLKIALESAIKMLNVGGRISVITFHSLEDRIVKDMFNKYSKVDSNLSKLPFVPSEFEPKYKTVLNITPSKEEINENSRARSSRLRVIERIKE